MRGFVRRLQLLLVLASAVILRSELHGTHDHILLSQFRDFPKLEGQVPVFIYIPQKQGGSVIPPGTAFPFGHLRLAGLRCKYSSPPPHGRPELSSNFVPLLTSRQGPQRIHSSSTVSCMFHIATAAVYRVVAQKWVWYIRPTCSHCIVKAIHATMLFLK
jgi:hypothetical protein